ncbi:MAG: hypothetical protein OXH75_04590 [Acidobacteria bacterium]|nr:hypothetical protein [Acidobacteriota bacterium]
MSPELQAVLEIAAAGSTLLFAALAGLIGLMYVLTAPWSTRRPTLRTEAARPALDDARSGSGFGPEDRAERARRERAVALAVAVARAELERPAAGEGSTEWRRAHRTRLMDRPSTRAASRRGR